MGKTCHPKTSDRISGLHDSILHHILYFLPYEDVVRTSILSKRWKNLWISLPYVRFEHLEFEFNPTRNKKFVNFVDNFLQYHDNSSMIKFILICKSACDASHVQRWTDIAVKAGVQELILCTRDVKIRRFPSSIFNCHTLVTLNLNVGNWAYAIPFPRSFCFPKLNSLSVYKIIFAKNFVHQLLRNPNLEKLFIYECVLESNVDPHPEKSESQVIDDEYLATGTEILPKFDQSYIDLNGKVNNLLRALWNVKVLVLTSCAIMVLDSERNLLNNLPTFFNLKCLVLKHLELTPTGHVRVMTCLLRCCPILQSLYVTLYGCRYGPRQKKLMSEQFESLCLPASLKLIILQQFYREDNQIELLRILLGNEFLEKIVVDIYKYEKDPILLRDELLLLPRPSTTNYILDITLPESWKEEGVVSGGHDL